MRTDSVRRAAHERVSISQINRESQTKLMGVKASLSIFCERPLNHMMVSVKLYSILALF